MNKLTPIPTDEQATLNTTVEGNMVHLVFSVKPNGDKGTARYNLEQNLDFEGVSQDELLEIASKPLRIDIQTAWRGAKDRMDADVWQGRTWKVRDMLDQGRSKASPTQKASNAVAKLSKAERDSLFAQYADELIDRDTGREEIG